MPRFDSENINEFAEERRSSFYPPCPDNDYYVKTEAAYQKTTAIQDEISYGGKKEKGE